MRKKKWGINRKKGTERPASGSNYFEMIVTLVRKKYQLGMRRGGKERNEPWDSNKWLFGKVAPGGLNVLLCASKRGCTSARWAREVIVQHRSGTILLTKERGVYLNIWRVLF